MHILCLAAAWCPIWTVVRHARTHRIALIFIYTSRLVLLFCFIFYYYIEPGIVVRWYVDIHSSLFSPSVDRPVWKCKRHHVVLRIDDMISGSKELYAKKGEMHQVSNALFCIANRSCRPASSYARLSLALPPQTKWVIYFCTQYCALHWRYLLVQQNHIDIAACACVSCETNGNALNKTKNILSEAQLNIQSIPISIARLRVCFV